MESVSCRCLKSTIGRTHRRLARPSAVRDWMRAAHRWASLRSPFAVFGWVNDPLGIAAGLEGWGLDEEEIRADLGYGRD